MAENTQGISILTPAVYAPEGEKETPSIQVRTPGQTTENLDPEKVRPYSSSGRRILPPISVAPADIERQSISLIVFKFMNKLTLYFVFEIKCMSTQ